MTNEKEIKSDVNTIKYNEESMIQNCFRPGKYCGCREKSAACLEEYLTMMQGYIPTEYNNDVHKKYEELFPVQTGKKVDKKIWTKPEKYLGKEFKRISKNIVNIYFPSWSEKLGNIFPF